MDIFSGIFEIDLQTIKKLDFDDIVSLLQLYNNYIYSLVIEDFKIRDDEYKDKLYFWLYVEAQRAQLLPTYILDFLDENSAIIENFSQKYKDKLYQEFFAIAQEAIEKENRIPPYIFGILDFLIKNGANTGTRYQWLPFYQVNPGLREFFRNADLGTYQGSPVQEYLEPFIEGNIPITRGFLVSLISQYAEANQMENPADSKQLISTQEFKDTFGYIFTNKGENPDNFSRMFTTSIVAELLEDKVDLSLERVDFR